MPRLLAASDDLTGAVACGGELRRAGLSVEVQPWDRREPSAADAVVVDTASRLLPPSEAAARVASCDNIGYKRIDSGLRGNVAAELAALARPCVLAPAAPAYGIVTRGGVQLLDGRPVTESHYGADPGAAASSRLADWLPGPVAELPAGQMDNLASALSRARFVVCDAESAADLAAVARAAAGLDAVLVGSYGLAAAWAGSRARGPGVLIVAGSLKETTREQVRELAARSFERDAAGAAAEVEAGGEAVLAREPAAPDPRVADELGAETAEVLGRARPAGVVLIGGELASAVVRACGTRAVEILAEPWPATPLVRFRDGLLDGLRGIVKSGARGDRHWLGYAVGMLRS